MLASIAGPDERTAGRARRGSGARTAGNAAVQRAQRGHRRRCSVRGSSPTAAESSWSRAAKRAGRRVEVGDERLELLAVAVERLGGDAGLRRCSAPRSSVCGALRARRRRSRCRGRRASSTGSSGCSRAPPLPFRPEESSSQQRLQVLARSAPAARSRTWSSCTGALGLVDRDAVAVAQLRRRRRARAGRRRRSCPRGRCAGGSSSSRPCGSAGPSCRSASSRRAACLPSSTWPIAGDLADVDAGDPHRRARADVVGRREDGRAPCSGAGTGSPW